VRKALQFDGAFCEADARAAMNQTTAVPDVALQVAERLRTVGGVAAVVLGGSVARGDADARSDVDLGLYYDPARPFAIPALREIARELDDRHTADLLTDFGGWGPWINGGGWLVIGGVRVDWIYRDLTRVGGDIADCVDGRYATHYQPGHPHAFHTHMYMAEVHHGRALVDRQGGFAALQTYTVPYPPRLRETVVQRNLWEAQFALENAAKAPARGDTFYVAGCLFRCAAGLVQAVFAVNGRYFLNEKRSVAIAGGLRIRPERFAETITDVLAATGRTADALEQNLTRMENLVRATRVICGLGG
jgi:predicted nucleotidyltransferase